jgi:hypothetical protein
MGLKDEVVADSTAPPWHKKAWVITRLGKEGPEFEALLADPGMHYVAITRALRRRNIEIPSRTIYRWTREARGEATT